MSLDFFNNSIKDADPEVYENPEKYCGKIEESRTLESIDYSSEFNESESDVE